jgi:hypothetical protein
MTLAWYGHLRFKEAPLAGVIVVLLDMVTVAITLRIFHAAAMTAKGGWPQSRHRRRGRCRYFQACADSVKQTA